MVVNKIIKCPELQTQDSTRNAEVDKEKAEVDKEKAEVDKEKKAAETIINSKPKE